MFTVNNLHIWWNLNAAFTLCQSTLWNLWHSTVLTSESARVSDFSPHVIFAVKWHRICDLTVAVIDKTSSDFNLCHHKNSLPFTLIPVFLRHFRDPIWVPRIRENYHRVPKISENRVPRFKEIGFLQIHTRYLTFSLKKTANTVYAMWKPIRMLINFVIGITQSSKMTWFFWFLSFDLNHDFCCLI